MTKQIRLDLAQTLSTVATASGGDSPDLAVAYVVWAIEHPQRFRMLNRAHSFVDNVTTTPRSRPGALPSTSSWTACGLARSRVTSPTMIPRTSPSPPGRPCTAWPRCSSTAD